MLKLRLVLTALACAGVTAATAAAPAAGAGLGPFPIASGPLDSPSPPSLAAGCASTTQDAQFASQQQLLSDNSVMARLGERPSGSPAQGRFIAWLQQQLASIPGMQMGSIPYAINRWTEKSASLSAGASTGRLASVPISGSVPYAQ